ncbi:MULTISPECIES: helix-turn-helix domain-containing protein [Kocuria]|uniref:Helix-turn-helix domain-containing protein n=1 Tax=Kocuria subflava TaxID=1736139 RepID=A0A846UAB6_9MICC|nr:MULTISPECIES: helix-turn-helix domain-containing protein [unclassified Kocuria]NKE10466.1 helix-turn-helix domain-containing protein [Kocuria subflava]
MADAQFYTLSDVAEVLSASPAQVRAMVRSGELPAIQIGGRGQWRVQISVFEQWVQQKHQETAQAVRSGVDID